MAIAKKPNRNAVNEKQERSLDDLIAKGGSSAKRVEVQEEQPKKVQLRIMQNKLNEIDDLLKKRPVSPSRHQWILEAIHEKIERDVSTLK